MNSGYTLDRGWVLVGFTLPGWVTHQMSTVGGPKTTASRVAEMGKKGLYGRNVARLWQLRFVTGVGWVRLRKAGRWDGEMRSREKREREGGQRGKKREERKGAKV